jgi:hypothetical protein
MPLYLLRNQNLLNLLGTDLLRLGSTVSTELPTNLPVENP